MQLNREVKVDCHEHSPLSTLHSPLPTLNSQLSTLNSQLSTSIIASLRGDDAASSQCVCI